MLIGKGGQRAWFSPGLIQLDETDRHSRDRRSEESLFAGLTLLALTSFILGRLSSSSLSTDQSFRSLAMWFPDSLSLGMHLRRSPSTPSNTAFLQNSILAHPRLGSTRNGVRRFQAAEPRDVKPGPWGPLTGRFHLVCGLVSLPWRPAQRAADTEGIEILFLVRPVSVLRDFLNIFTSKKELTVPMTWYREMNDELPRYVVKLHILTPTSFHPRSYRPACYMNKITCG